MAEVGRTHERPGSKMSRFNMIKTAAAVIAGGGILVGCGEAISPTITPDIASPTPITEPIRPTDIPTVVTPTTGYVETVPASVAYVEPALADMEILPGAGGSGRDEVLLAGVNEDDLYKLEKAAFLWFSASGYPASSISLDYVNNRLPGDDFRWVMAGRDTQNNILWAVKPDGAFDTFPIAISGVAPDTTKKAEVIEGSEVAVVVFKDNGNYPVAVRHPIEAMDGKTYYSEWFNTLTGEWEKDAAVEVIPKRPEYIKYIPYSLDGFTLVENQEELSLIMKDIQDYPVLPYTESSPTNIIDSYPEGKYTFVVIQCRMGDTCAVRAALRTPDSTNELDRWFLVWEVRVPSDDRSHFIITYIGENVGEDLLKKQTEKDILPKIRDAAQKNAEAVLFIPVKTADLNQRFSNPVLSEYVNPKSVDQRNALDELEEKHTISDKLSQFPVWLQKIVRRA